MKRNENYNTRQREIILDAIRKNKNEFTIKDIHLNIKDKVGLTTVYRLVDKLVEEGLLNKFIGKDNITYYQYLEKCEHQNHFYLKCESCGDIVHVDCDCIEEITNHIFLKHDFKPSREHIIIYGICKNCIIKGV